MGVPICFARSRSDGISTAGTGKAAGAGVAAVDGVGRSSGTGVLALRADDRGAPPGPNPYSTAGVYHRLLSLFVGASSTTEGPECQAGQRRILLKTRATVGGVPPFSLPGLNHLHK